MKALLILYLALFAAVNGCDLGWEKIGNSCYKAFQPEPEDEPEQIGRTCCTYQQAKTYCEELGSHLVHITSMEEQENVKAWLKNIDSTDVWLGLYSPTPGGTFFYSDGCQLPAPLADELWSTTGRNEEVSCVRMEQTEDEDFYWSDRDCDWFYGFVCETRHKGATIN